MYLFMALASGLLWGVWGFGYGRYGRVMSRYSVILISACGAALVYLTAGLIGHDIVIDMVDVSDGLFGGLLNLLGSVMLLRAVTVGKIGVASGVSAAYVLVPLGYSFVIGEAISTRDIAGGLVIIFALVLFFLPKEGASGPATRPLLSLALASASAIFFGVAVVVLDVGTKNNLYGTLFVGQLPGIAVSLVMLASARSFGGLKARDIGPLAATGLALGLAGVAFYTAADHGDLGIASVISSINPVATAVLAYVFLKEKLVRSEIRALAILLAGIALIVI